jgi:predicted O-linked N-acetylglucosamine transferase (SPINDLY family)/predicted TPR repeat methyltransferase
LTSPATPGSHLLDGDVERLLAAGRLLEARDALVRLCEERPEDPDPWLYLAAIDEQAGLYLDAERYALRALAIEPREAEIHRLVARVRWARGATRDALLAAESASRLDPDVAAAWLELGAMRRAVGDAVGAESALRRALALAPGDGRTHVLLARALLGQGRDGEAAALCAAVAPGDPAWAEAEDVLGRMSRDGAPRAGARAAGRGGPPECPEGGDGRAPAPGDLEARRRHYDGCAHTYDYLTSEVARYRVPAWLARELRRRYPRADRSLTVLDAGCGTGACGAVLRPIASALTGVDISPPMLDLAASRWCYDTLVQEDAIAFMRARPQAFDVVVAADVFETEAELGAALGAARATLRPGGTLFLVPGARRVRPDGFDAGAPGVSLTRLRRLAAGAEWAVERAGRTAAYRLGDRAVRAPFLVLRAGRGEASGAVLEVEASPREAGVGALLAAQAAQGKNQLMAAARLYRRALRLNRGSADAWCGLGLVHQSRGGARAARRCYRRAIEGDPTHFVAWFQLGTLAQLEGHAGRAEEQYRRAIAFEPGLAAAYHNLGVIRHRAGNLAEAGQLFFRAILEEPALAGLATPDSPTSPPVVGGGDGEEVRGAAPTERALALLTQGVKLRERGSSRRAIEALGEAARLAPNEVVVHVQLALALQLVGRLDEALESLHRAAELSQTPWFVWDCIAGAHALAGDWKQSYRWWGRAAEKAPPDSHVQSNRLFMLNYSDRLTARALADEHLAWGRRVEAAIAPLGGPFTNPPEPDRRLRVGYLSADFFGHSVAYFLEPLLAWHDHDRVEVHCYANVERYDAMTTRQRYLADRWLRVRHLDDRQLAEQIRADRIDVLVDLSGHTGGNRLPVLAYRPAPVQATYLGYPNTTGLDRVDYRITDGAADPEGLTETGHSERLQRLSRCFLAYRPLNPSPSVRWAPPPGGRPIMLGCFNNLYKVTERVLDVWSRILHQLPDAVIVIKSQTSRATAAGDRVRQRLAANGIDPRRLHVPGKLGMQEHLDLYARMDVMLDPFPYNGTTTTCETLWMGVPVVALAGDRHSGRVGVSLLTAVGLDELIAPDEDAYVRLAVELARDRDRLAEYRCTMRARLRASPLMDGRALARAIEAAYRDMWLAWCASDPP